jgi:ketopantoate hydroxymethyltransferase
MNDIQGVSTHATPPEAKPWPDLDERTEAAVRHFEAAVRKELGTS